MKVEWVRVADILRLERRSVIVDPTAEYEEIGVRSFGRGIFHKEPVAGVELGNKRVFRIEPGDLVLSNIFAWEGAIAVASERERGKVGSHRFMTFVPTVDRISTDWAAWFFQSERGLELIGKASPGSAGRNRTLAIERFENLEIPLPPLDEQRRIAAALTSVSSVTGALQSRSIEAARQATALPHAVRHLLEQEVPLERLRLGELLTQVREPVQIDASGTYVTLGIRSFGNGVFHYPPRYGSEIGKLRFFQVRPGLLAISNIKAWEGAIATTGPRDADTVASNRFLFFRAQAGEDAIDYFWSLLLSPEGLLSIGRASPGSADRNRTLAVERFLNIELPVPNADRQVEIGRSVSAVRARLAERERQAAELTTRIDALLPAALNRVLSRLS